MGDCYACSPWRHDWGVTVEFQCRERLMGDCYGGAVVVLVLAIIAFQCRERLMGDCYKAFYLSMAIAGAYGFQCRERLMGDCYVVPPRDNASETEFRFSAANG